MNPYYADDQVTLHYGDLLAVLPQMETASVDAIVTDPPYSSGGQYRGDRSNRSTAVKYMGIKTDHPAADFTGDNRDQRGFAYWCALWLGELLRIARPGAALAVSCDWRQLPTLTDAVQAGGWVWRGVLPWCKPDARPQFGRPRGAAEFYVWATAGPRPLEGECLPGYWVASWSRDKLHQTEKPLQVLRDLVRLAPPGGVVLDPFMGGGTTGIAALTEGRQFVGVDIDAHWCEVVRLRLAAARVRSLDVVDTLPLGEVTP